MAACTLVKSPLPLMSTLMVRLIPNFCVNIGESAIVSAWLVARAECEMQKMRIAERRKEEDEGRLGMS